MPRITPLVQPHHRAREFCDRFDGALQIKPPKTQVQSLVIRLDGITAADYLTWVRDPEPPALDHELRSVAISAEPLGELIKLELVWAGRPPTPTAAAVAAGFPLIPEVVAVLAGPETPKGLK